MPTNYDTWLSTPPHDPDAPAVVCCRTCGHYYLERAATTECPNCEEEEA
jgi:hypothetical protein